MSNFDNEYFDSLMDRGVKEGADPTLLEDAKKAFKRVPKAKLSDLFNSTPETFYKNYANVVCSAALDARTDHSALSRFFSKAKIHEGQEANEHGFFYNGMRFVAATLLGLVKFAWDTALITAAFTGRFAARLVTNVSRAVVDTCKETAVDGKYAIAEVQSSFRRNLVGEKEVPSDTPVEIVIDPEAEVVEGDFTGATI